MLQTSNETLALVSEKTQPFIGMAVSKCMFPVFALERLKHQDASSNRLGRKEVNTKNKP